MLWLLTAEHLDKSSHLSRFKRRSAIGQSSSTEPDFNDPLRLRSSIFEQESATAFRHSVVIEPLSEISSVVRAMSVVDLNIPVSALPSSGYLNWLRSSSSMCSIHFSSCLTPPMIGFMR